MKTSPNFTKGTRPKIGYIVHGTAGSYSGAVEWLCTPPEQRPVISYSSAHYVIAKDGRVANLIDIKDVAWHAGNISNPTDRARSLLPKKADGTFLNPNESFIGIELEWFLGDVITEAQYQAMDKIIKDSGIKDPVILSHKEVTDYKSDFQTADGKVDMTVVNEVIRRLKANPAPVASQTPSPVVPPVKTKLDTFNDMQKAIVIFQQAHGINVFVGRPLKEVLFGEKTQEATKQYR